MIDDVRDLPAPLHGLVLPERLVEAATRAPAEPAGADAAALEAAVARILQASPGADEPVAQTGSLQIDALIVAAARECLLLADASNEIADLHADRVRYGLVPALAQIGMWDLKRRLEDLVLETETPIRFRSLSARLSAFRARHEPFVEWARTAVEAQLGPAGVAGTAETAFCSVDGASRRLKALELGESFARARVTEFFELHVVVPTEVDCYRALAAVHRAGAPVPRAVEDLIATPRPNGFSGLQTQVSMVLPDAPLATLVTRVLIQTPLMHAVARHGIAVPECYALIAGQEERDGTPPFVHALVATINDGLDRMTARSTRSVAVLAKGGRKGLVNPYTLDEGATVLDLAYEIHRRIGTDADHALVNGRRVELGRVLTSGDRVEIVRSRSAQREEGDLRRVSTRRGRRLVRKDLNRDVVGRGRNLIGQYLELNRGVLLEDPAELDRAAAEAAKRYRAEIGDVSAEALYRKVGSGVLGKRRVGADVAAVLARQRMTATLPPNTPATEWIPALVPGVSARTNRFKLCGLCAPGPAHEIVGLDLSRHITVHQLSCVHVHGRTTIALKWERVDRPIRSVVTLYCEDRPLLVHSICHRISGRGSGLEEIHAVADEFSRARVTIHIHSSSTIALGDLLEDLRSVRSVRRLELASASLPEEQRASLASDDWMRLRRKLEQEHDVTGPLLIRPQGRANRRVEEIELPYNEQKPAYWTDAFFGRHDEIEELVGRMSGRGKSYVLISGPRRIGKTSLALRFVDALPEATRPNVFRIDLRTNRTASSATVLTQMAATLRPLGGGSTPSHDDPRDVIAALVSRSEKPVLLILDEFAAVLESFERGTLGDELFAWIRTTMEGEHTVSDRLNLVMVAPPEGVELLHSPRIQPYLDRLAPLRISTLRHDAAREMIMRPFIAHEIRVNRQAVDALVTMTAGHPYYLILYLRRIVAMLNERRTKWDVTAEDVSRCTPLVLRHPYCFHGAVNEPGSLGTHHTCLRALAGLQRRNDEGVVRTEVIRRAGLAMAVADDALDRLVAYDVVERQIAPGHEPSYRFTIPLVRAWVRAQGQGDLGARRVLAQRGAQ